MTGGRVSCRRPLQQQRGRRWASSLGFLCSAGWVSGWVSTARRLRLRLRGGGGALAGALRFARVRPAATRVAICSVPFCSVAFRSAPRARREASTARAGRANTTAGIFAGGALETEIKSGASGTVSVLQYLLGL